IYGFLPSPGWISGQGVITYILGCGSIVSTLGLFARSLCELEFFCKVYSLSSPWIKDIFLIPSDILSLAISRQLNLSVLLRIGILFDNGVISPLLPIRQVIDKVRSCLRCKASVIITSNYFEDASANICKIYYAGFKSLEYFTEWMLNKCRTSDSQAGSTQQIQRATRDAFRRLYAAHWKRADVDIIISPVTPSTAPPLGTSRYWGYSAIWNLLQYMVVAMPDAALVGEGNGA
ncbi:amidase signature domain-containing protein, partial [Fusarium oxysporum]